MPRLKLSDRITWAVLGWMFFNLLWLKFLEALVPIWAGAIIATAGAVLFVMFWPRPEEELEEEEESEAAERRQGGSRG